MTEYHFEINGSSYRIEVKETRAGHAIVEVNGTEYRVDIKTPAPAPAPSASPAPATPRSESAGVPTPTADGLVLAPLPGVIRKVMCKPNDAVAADQPLLVLEAMKMENEIKTPVAGTIVEVLVVVGDSVNTGDGLFRIQQ
jgi:biotin carboxyl carrier protein